MPTIRRLPLCAAVLATSVLALTACSGGSSDSSSDASPTEVLAAAKKNFDDTSGVHLALTSSDLPDGVSALISADGDGTHAPAFKGEIKVAYAGFEPTVPVVAVDGVTYAQLPLTTGWQKIDPSEYGAPDPAKLLSTDDGFSSLLTATTDAEKGDQVRGGEDNKQILTEYTGTIDQDAARAIIPTATGEFDVSYTIDDSEQLQEMVVTGDFYDKGSASTYTIAFSDYGSTPDITAPE